MFGLIAHLTANGSGISDLFFRTFWVALFAKPIGKVKGIEVFSCKKPQCDNAITQKRSANTVVVDERNVFNVPAPLRDGAVINDKVTLFERVFFELVFFGYLQYDQVHKRSPSKGIALKTVKSIPSDPTIHPTEDLIRTIQESSSICLMDCMCRTRKNLIGKGCGRPVNTCMFLNQFADHLNEIGKGKQISKEEAVKILTEAEDAGLIHVSNNSHEQLFGICSCCGCCCIELQTLIKLKAPAAVAKSDFKLMIDIDLCSGCEDCLDKCWFEALSIENELVVVNRNRCMGCGACVKACPMECLTLQRKPPEEIEPTPSDYVEMLSEMGWR